MRLAAIGFRLLFRHYERRGGVMGEIGEPDRVVRRDREPVITPAVPAQTPALEPVPN